MNGNYKKKIFQIKKDVLLILYFLPLMTGCCQNDYISVSQDIVVCDNYGHGDQKYIDSIYEINAIFDIPYDSVYGFYSSYRSLKDVKELLSPNNKKLELCMDIYSPVDSLKERHPTILFIHGGAFFFDSKESPSIVKWCKRFASRGYVTVSINYRLSWPLGKNRMRSIENDAIHDAIAAIDFLVQNQETFAIDANNLFLAGTSAGAMIALQVPLHCLQSNYTIRAIANMWGAIPDTSLLSPDYPALVSFHGGRDHIVPPDYNCLFYNWDYGGLLSKFIVDKKYGSSPIHQKLTSYGVKNKFFFFPSLKHKLHWDKKQKTENKYFYFIDKQIDSFFYEEIKKS